MYVVSLQRDEQKDKGDCNKVFIRSKLVSGVSKLDSCGHCSPSTYLYGDKILTFRKSTKDK